MKYYSWIYLEYTMVGVPIKLVFLSLMKNFITHVTMKLFVFRYQTIQGPNILQNLQIYMKNSIIIGKYLKYFVFTQLQFWGKRSGISLMQSNLLTSNPGVYVLFFIWPWLEAFYYWRIVDEFKKIDAQVSQALRGCNLLTVLLFDDPFLVKLTIVSSLVDSLASVLL